MHGGRPQSLAAWVAPTSGNCTRAAMQHVLQPPAEPDDMQLVANVPVKACEHELNLTNEGTSTVAILLHLKAFATALSILQAETSLTLGKWCNPFLTLSSSCTCIKFSALHTGQRGGHCWGIGNQDCA